MVKYIIYEETDEFLTYEMDRLINYHNKEQHLPEFHKVAYIIENKKIEKPFFKDTLMLETGDNELVPYRELFFSIQHKNNDFTIVLRQLIPGNDDIFLGTLMIVIGLILLIVFTLFFMIKTISGNIWKPFYTTLNKLTNYRMTEPLPIFPKTDIDEFNRLNSGVNELLHKIASDYKRTKEFNENASHELQTHLAVIRANSEKLLNSNTLNTTQVQTILNTTISLSNIQKSLLIYSKIGNLEYNNRITLNIKELVEESLELFYEVIEIRNITLARDLEDCLIKMDSGLAKIMINNLIKNSVKHNYQDGVIKIKLNSVSFSIENSGLEYKGDPNELLERFTIGKKGNLGIGLSIVKQICELYKFKISYQINQNAIHKITINFLF